MCIRDRFQIDYLTTLSNQAVVSLLYHKKLDDEWRQQAEALRDAPVSYTHLDVYKRQVHITSPTLIAD